MILIQIFYWKIIFINILNQNGFAILNKVCVSHATRIENKKRKNSEIKWKSSSIIDHIATNIIEYDYCISISNTDLSDHKQILLSIKNTFGYVNSNISTSVKKKIKLHSEISWLIHTLPQYLFWIELRIIQWSHVKPWLNEKLLDLIKERDRYAKLLKKNPDDCYLIECRKDYSKRVIKLKNILIKTYNYRQIADLLEIKDNCGKHLII